MQNFQMRLTTAMKERGIRATDLSRETGLSKARISQYVNGRYIPKSDAILLLADVLNVSPLWLMGEDVPMNAQPESADKPALGSFEGHPLPDNVEPIHLRRYPILGEIACGKPLIAEENYESGYVTAAETEADFTLTAKGDSMIGARIFDGDQVFIQKTDMVENGEIAAVVVDDGEATLKRVFYYPEESKILLVAENPDYDPLVFVNEELNHVFIMGRAVAFQSRVH